MKVNRAAFLSPLEEAKPALLANSIIDALTNFWFNGTTVTAFNDVIGIEAPCETDFVGGVPGKLLMGFLERIDSDEVTIQALETEINISAGRSHLTIPLVELEQSVWEFPEFNEETYLFVSDELLKAFKMLLVSVSETSSISEHRGITFIFSKDYVDLYSTDANTLAWCRITDTELPHGKLRITPPGEFFKQVLRLSTKGDKLYLSDNYMITENVSGIKLFTRLLDVERPLNFARAIKQQIKDGCDPVPVPTGLASVLDRVNLIREGKNAEPVQVSVLDNQFDFFIRTPLGEVRDRLDVDGKHPNVSGKFDPNRIARSLEGRETLFMNDNALIMYGPEGFVCLIATLHE